MVAQPAMARGYQDIYNMWKENLKSMLSDANNNYIEATRLINKVSKDNPEYKKALKLYQDASYNLLFVKVAKGIHNIDYASSLLDKASSDFKQVIELLSHEGKTKQKTN